MDQRPRGPMALVIAIGIVLDQASKAAAERILAPTDLFTYLGGIVRIQMVRNHGAFLSLGATLPPGLRTALLTGGVGIFVLCLLWWIFFYEKSTDVGRWAMVCVASGGIANLIDRVRFQGGVLDFLNVGIGGLRTGIFNVADMYITFAVIFLVVHSFFQKKDGAQATT